MAEKALQVIVAVTDGVKVIGGIKDLIYNLKVSEKDATAFQREIEGEIFDKFHERMEVMTSTVEEKHLGDYLHHLQEDYEGITPQIARKLKGIMLVKNLKYGLYETKFNTGEDKTVYYGLIAVKRNGNDFDFWYSNYKLEFQVTPHKFITTKKHSCLFGLINWRSESEKIVEKKLGTRTHNFFRNKALQAIKDEGYSVNTGNSISDVTQ